MEGGWSPLDTCPISPLEEVLSELQAVLTLFRCHSTIDAVNIVVARHSMWRWWMLPWEASHLPLFAHTGYCCFLQFVLPSQGQGSSGSLPRVVQGPHPSPSLFLFQALLGFPTQGPTVGLTCSCRGATLGSPPTLSIVLFSSCKLYIIFISSRWPFWYLLIMQLFRW